MSPDDRLAAATWGALHHLTDSRTGQRKPNTGDHFPTFAGRLQNLRNHGITAHRGRKDYDTLPKPPEPQTETEMLKNQEIEEFLRHEMNTHLIPNTILFVPGDATHPPKRTDETKTPTLASYNMFAAIGLAYQLKFTAIWAINHNKNEENSYNVVDLRTRTGRDHEKIVDGRLQNSNKEYCRPFSTYQRLPNKLELHHFPRPRNPNTNIHTDGLHVERRPQRIIRKGTIE
jgi:hypothetical protein